MGPLSFLPMLMSGSKKILDVGQAQREQSAMEGYAKRKFETEEKNAARDDRAARRQALLSIMGYSVPSYRSMRAPEPRLPYEAFKKSKFSQGLDVADSVINNPRLREMAMKALPMAAGIPSPGIGMDALFGNFA